MNLDYIVQPTDLGGTAVPGCGTIHQSEIKATLTKLSDDLEFPFDFNDYIIGSTGKREYSGDIDVVLDSKWWDHGVTAFRDNLEQVFGKESVARNGDMLHLRYPIIGYEPLHNKCLPRTGFVQIDFNLADYEWDKFYHYSHAESAYKGGHRNLMISAICSKTHMDILDHTPDSFNRPISTIRWKWGSNGLIRVQRTSAKDRDGNWMRKQKDEVLTLPYKDPADIADILFPDDGAVDDMLSMETLMAAVKRNFGMVDQERVWKGSARNFSDWNQGKMFHYPLEISRYFLPNDK